MESPTHYIDPSYPLAASRPISQFAAKFLHRKNNTCFSNAPSSHPSRSPTPLSMSASEASHSAQSPCVTSSPGPSTPREWTISPSIPYSSFEIYSRPTLPSFSSLFPELDEHEQGYRHHQPKYHVRAPSSHQQRQRQRQDHYRLSSCDYTAGMDIYLKHLTTEWPGYHPYEYHPYLRQYQHYQQYQLHQPHQSRYQPQDGEVRVDHQDYAYARPFPVQAQEQGQEQAQAQTHAQAQAQAQAQGTNPSVPVPLHLTSRAPSSRPLRLSHSPSSAAALPSPSFASSISSTLPFSSSPLFPSSFSSFSSSSSFSKTSSSKTSSSRPTVHHTQTQHHRHQPYPSQHHQRYNNNNHKHNYSQYDTNNREMFHSQSSFPPSPSHYTHHPHAQHPYHPYHDRNNSTLPPREAPSPLLNIDFLQAKPSSSSSASSSSTLLSSSTPHSAVYSRHQSYQNLLSALPKSSPSTPKVKPPMERYSRFQPTSPPPDLSTLDPRNNSSINNTNSNSMKARFVPTPYGSPALTDEDLYSEWSSRSPSPLTRDTVSMAYGSPQLRSMMDYFETMSDGSVSVDSLISDNSDSHHLLHHHINNTRANISSSSSASASTQNKTTTTTTTTTSTGKLLLCPVCDKAFKPSKNQNCNLRRHLKNVHDMSPTIHPRKCKWDSLPDGRVKDDKDRKERTRKSKRLWARKFRLRRKVEEAAEVLTMLNQAN